MTKQAMRAFAFGLLAASFALFIYKETADSASLSEKAMIEKLEDKQYTVWTAEEAARQKQAKEELQQQLDRLTSNPDEKVAQKEHNNEKNEQKAYTLHIKPGMASAEVGRLLEKAGIVEDSEQFNTYLTENGYAGKLQIGEHPVYSSMSMKEIAIVLTTK